MRGYTDRPDSLEATQAPTPVFNTHYLIKVLSTTLLNAQNIEPTLEIPSRIQKLQQSNRWQQIEEKLAKSDWKIIGNYNDIYSFECEPAPCTTLTEHEIFLKSEKVINIKSYRPPECHKEEFTRQISELHKKRSNQRFRFSTKQMDADQLISDNEIDEESTPIWSREIYKEYIK